MARVANWASTCDLGIGRPERRDLNTDSSDGWSGSCGGRSCSVSGWLLVMRHRGVSVEVHVVVTNAVAVVLQVARTYNIIVANNLVHKNDLIARLIRDEGNS